MAWDIGAYEYQGSAGANVPLTGVSITATQGTPSVVTSANVTLTGSSLTASQGTITVDTGVASWAIANVDLDDSIFEGQTGVNIAITGTVAESGKKVFIAQGENWVEQTVTGETTSSITINVSYGGILNPGAATLYVRNPL